MTDDGTWDYTWNAENRLVVAEPDTPATNDLKFLYTYDYMGRRVRKQVYTYQANATWDLTTDEVFVYDGWNPVLVLDATDSNAVLRTYTWGIDLSGTLQGAGGVGGLLRLDDGDDVYYYVYDANGNVSEVIDDAGNVDAHYEYTPFGRRGEAETARPEAVGNGGRQAEVATRSSPPEPYGNNTRLVCWFPTRYSASGLA